MKSPWEIKLRSFRPKRFTSTKQLELETAKEILAEVFHVRHRDVDEMIQIRLERRDQQDKLLWPTDFCLDENHGSKF